jgi:hypothetical protein
LYLLHIILSASNYLMTILRVVLKTNLIKTKDYFESGTWTN